MTQTAKQAVGELPEETLQIARDKVDELVSGWKTEGYRRALRDVLEDVEENKFLPDSDEGGNCLGWVVPYPELTAKIKARLEQA